MYQFIIYLYYNSLMLIFFEIISIIELQHDWFIMMNSARLLSRVYVGSMFSTMYLLSTFKSVHYSFSIEAIAFDVFLKFCHPCIVHAFAT